MENIEKLNICINELDQILRPSFILDTIPEEYKDYYIFTKKYSGLCENCGGRDSKDYEVVLSKQAHDVIYSIFLQIEGMDPKPTLDKYQNQVLINIFNSLDKFQAHRACQQAVLNYKFSTSDMKWYSDVIMKTGIYPPPDEVYLTEDILIPIRTVYFCKP